MDLFIETSRVAYDRLNSIGIGSRNEESRLAISHSGLVDEEDLNMQDRSSQNMRPIQVHFYFYNQLVIF